MQISKNPTEKWRQDNVKTIKYGHNINPRYISFDIYSCRNTNVPDSMDFMSAHLYLWLTFMTSFNVQYTKILGKSFQLYCRYCGYRLCLVIVMLVTELTFTTSATFVHFWQYNIASLNGTCIEELNSRSLHSTLFYFSLLPGIFGPPKIELRVNLSFHISPFMSFYY